MGSTTNNAGLAEALNELANHLDLAEGVYADEAAICRLAASALSTAPALDELEVVAWDRLRELIGEYFDIGYAEGVVQRTADTMADDAQRTLSEIEAIISQAHSTIAALRAEVVAADAEQAAWRTRHSLMVKRAETAEAEVKRLTEALTDARTWHEEQDKALSKQPPSSGPNGNQWARLQHREQIDLIDAALSGSEKE